MRYAVKAEFTTKNLLPMEMTVADYSAAITILNHWAEMFKGYLSALYYAAPDGTRVYHPDTPAPAPAPVPVVEDPVTAPKAKKARVKKSG